ncbi:hypothetical protein [Mycolicibacterium sp.]|uniref:hypothetical protein n=1 Tax=Mycolicibacterium sp. TaxID=2320850 RepID=UPI00355E87DD
MTTFASDGTPQTAAAPSNAPAAHPAPPADPAPASESLPAVPAATAVATPAAPTPWTHEGEWEHDWLDFHGDRLAFRVPKSAAIQGFVMAQSKYAPADLRGEAANLFLIKHLSPESFDRVLFRMSNPDDPAYSIKTVSELVEAIMNPGIEVLKAEAEALTAGEDEPKTDEKA